MTDLFIDNPSCLELSDLVACGTTDLIIDATVTGTVFDPDDVEVTGETWPLAMPFDSVTNIYRGVTAAGLGLTEGVLYRVNIVAKDGGGNVLTDQDLIIRATNRRTT